MKKACFIPGVPHRFWSEQTKSRESSLLTSPCRRLSMTAARQVERPSAAPLEALDCARSPCPVRRDLEHVMQSMKHNEDFEIQFRGRLPAELQGTMFRVMPGNFAAGNAQPYESYLDGDGYVMRVTFGGSRNKAHVKTSFVETAGFVAEKKAGRVLHRNVFGTERKGGWIRNAFDVRLKNTANTGIVHWNNELLALWEGGLPHSLSPTTLETNGEFHLDGVLSSGIPFDMGERTSQMLNRVFGLAGDTWSGHPKTDEANGKLINFGYRMRADKFLLKVYEWGSSTDMSSFLLDCIPMMFHDFLVTPSYYVFLENSVRVRKRAYVDFISGRKSAFDIFYWDESKGSRLIVLPRKQTSDLGAPHIIDCPPLFSFHHVCANESPSGDLSLTTLALDVSKAGPSKWPSDWDFFNSKGIASLPALCFTYPVLMKKNADVLSLSSMYVYCVVPANLCRISVNLEGRAEATVERLSKIPTEFGVLCGDGIYDEPQFVFLGVGDPKSKASGVPRGYGKFNIRTGKMVDSWIPKGRFFVGEGVFVRRGTKREDDGYFIGFRHAVDKKETIIEIYQAWNLSRGPIATGIIPKAYPMGLHSSWTDKRFNVTRS